MPTSAVAMPSTSTRSPAPICRSRMASWSARRMPAAWSPNCVRCPGRAGIPRCAPLPRLSASRSRARLSRLRRAGAAARVRHAVRGGVPDTRIEIRVAEAAIGLVAHDHRRRATGAFAGPPRRRGRNGRARRRRGPRPAPRPRRFRPVAPRGSGKARSRRRGRAVPARTRRRRSRASGRPNRSRMPCLTRRLRNAMLCSLDRSCVRKYDHYSPQRSPGGGRQRAP